MRRHVPAEGPVHEQMLRRRGQPLFAADDRIDGHQVIVDNDRQLVGREAIGLEEDLILDRVQRPLDVAVDEVVDRDRAFLRDLQPDHVVRLALRPLSRFRRRNVPAVAVIPGDLAASPLGRAHLLEPLFAAEAVVRGAAVDELLGPFLIERQALGLDIRSVRSTLARALVPAHPEPVQTVVDAVDRAGDQALLIGVLDPEDERALALAGEEIVVQGGPNAPDMERAGRGWRESHPHAHQRESKDRKLGP